MVDLVNELEGKVAIVTGSARNIGRATAIELARAGAAVVIHSRETQDLCDEVVAEIEGFGGRAISCCADIRDEEAVKALVEKTVSELGGVDILINSAAMRANQKFTEIDDESWDRVVGTGLRGSFNMARHCVPEMIKRGGGSIISLGGMGAHQGSERRAHVMATKAGIGALMRGIAMDHGPDNIRANNVVVGVFATERSHNAPKSSHADDLLPPLGRRGVPQDIADLIRFLVGPGATYISGQTIQLNGGIYNPH
jgi:3-oxoacyl-[acyl-carrier protein] reductase